LQKSGGDDSVEHRPTGSADPPSTTKVSQQRRPATSDTAAASAVDEFDVYTIETALPHVQWERIEQSLRMSAGEQKKRWVSEPVDFSDFLQRRC